MTSKIEQNLGKDIVNLMECLFESGKKIFDYKISGNKIGCTVILRMTEYEHSHGLFTTGKSPSRQLRDAARHKDHMQQRNTSVVNKGTQGIVLRTCQI